MFKSKKLIASALVGAATMASPAAFAGWTANVGAFSEYMFRGVEQTAGAAVQGGVDYAHDGGFYAGLWGSNIGFAGGTEVDAYGGWTHKFNDTFGIDLGALYYWYPEEDQALIDPSINTLELYAGAIIGPVVAKVYYTDEYFGSEEEGIYFTAAAAFPLSETINFNINLGQSDGDGVEAIFGDSYLDYGLGVSKSLDGGLTASFAFVGTDLDGAVADDDPKFVIGLKKVFEL